MDAVQEVDSLIGMVRTLLCNSGQPRFITPEYREFHDRLTDFIYRNHLDETEDWAVIQMNLMTIVLNVVAKKFNSFVV